MFHNWTSFVFIMTVLSSLGSAQKVDQPESATAFAGTSYELLCNLSSVSTEYIQWYRQFPGRGPQYIASVYPGSTGEGTHPKSTLRAAKDKKSSVLVLHHVTLADAATYFCALSDASYTGIFDKMVFGPGTSLTIRPDLEDSSPSVYQLMPKHKETTDGPDAQERTAACLFTDYSPNPLKVGINEESMEKINGSVVVVTEDDDDQKGTPSYGIVLWGNNENLDCTAHDKDNNVFRTNPEDPGICSEDDGTTTFETDERLNLLSLSVLGLRIIFFKAIAFNVLLTFHVYSRRVRK